MRRALKHTLITANTVFMVVGYVGGSLTSRLYFLHGGHRRWLSSSLETAGFPFLLLPLFLSYFYRCRRQNRNNNNNNNKPPLKSTAPVLSTPRIFAACAVLGLMIGADDFLYAYGLSFLPVSTSVLLLSTHLAFTALFAFLIVKQKFTAFSVNAITLLSMGAVVLGLHASSDRPNGVSRGEYYLGFVLTLSAAVLYGLVLPLIELMYRKVEQAVSYTLVMEMQLVMGLFATVLCIVGMLVDNDFKVIPREAAHYKLGKAKYCMVLISNAILWQFFYLGTVGVIFSANTLYAAIIIAVCVPLTELSGVIFLHESFSSEKGVALALSLWGLASYTYGEYLKGNEERRKEQLPSSPKQLQSEE